MNRRRGFFRRIGWCVGALFGVAALRKHWCTEWELLECCITKRMSGWATVRCRGCGARWRVGARNEREWAALEGVRQIVSPGLCYHPKGAVPW